MSEDGDSKELKKTLANENVTGMMEEEATGLVQVPLEDLDLDQMLEDPLLIPPLPDLPDVVLDDVEIVEDAGDAYAEADVVVVNTPADQEKGKGKKAGGAGAKKEKGEKAEKAPKKEKGEKAEKVSKKDKAAAPKKDGKADKAAAGGKKDAKKAAPVPVPIAKFAPVKKPAEAAKPPAGDGNPDGEKGSKSKDGDELEGEEEEPEDDISDDIEDDDNK
jgi:26S proteasome regulatory subunit, ATPase 3, interacting protein